jgi:DNA polymerase III delta prime subunit
LSSYNPPKELKNWVENDMDNKSLILIGKPGTGKTEYLIALLNSLGLNPFLVKDLNILRELTPLNKAIIFDDISISHLDAMQKLSLFDKEQDTQLRILYKSIRINQSTIKAFTKNDLESLLPSDDTYFEAMKRRVAIVTIDKPLFNIQINVDNRIDIIIDNSTTNITNIIEKKMDNIINTEEEKNNINDVSILFC